MNPAETELSVERRALLAEKGRILYRKSCGTRGRGICAESFARHQLRLGNVDVVRDLIEFLETQIRALESHDPDGMQAATRSLLTRIRYGIEAEIDEEPPAV